MKPIDIGPADLETVRRVLQEHVPRLEVWVFGSRVSWTARETSDLDIALMTTESLDVMRLAEMREAFVQSDLPFRVDIVDWSSTSGDFQKIIKMEHVVLAKVDHSSKWRKMTLGNIAPFVYGKGLPKRKRNSAGNVPVFGSNGIIGYHDIALTNKPTIIIGRKGTVGKVHYSSVPCWPIDTTFFITDNDIDLARFKYYALKTLGLEHMNTDSAVPGLNRNAAHDLFLFVPENSEQRAIAHILGTLDDKIELNRRMNKTLEEVARALFKSWFVDFDPVRAKMDGRWRPGESLPGLPAHLYDLFSDSLVDSELGEIPNGWEVKTLDQLTKLNPREPMKKGVVAPYLDMAALPTSGSSSDDAVLREFTSGTRFRNKDTLLARITPCLENGKAAFIQSLLNYAVGWGSTEFIVMRAIPPVPPEYAYLLARNPDFRAHAIQSMTGTSGRQRAQTEALASYPLPFPSVDIWLAFGLIVGQLFARMKSNNEEMHTLIATRDALLPKLISGELRIFQLAHERGMLK